MKFRKKPVVIDAKQLTHNTVLAEIRAREIAEAQQDQQPAPRQRRERGGLSME